MRVVFAHDHIFLKSNELFYSKGGLPLDALEQYRDVFGELIVLSRQEKSEYNDGFVLSSGKNIEFVKIPNFKSLKKCFKKHEAKMIIAAEVLKSDYVIARLPSSIGAMAVKSAIKFKKPYLIELVGCPFDALYHHSFLGKIIAPFSKAKTSKIMKNAKFSIYVTERYLQRKYPTKGLNTNCSNVVLKDISDDNLKKRLYKIENNLDYGSIIGTLGSLDVKYKGQKFVIDSLLKHDRNMQYTYEMVGSNEENRYSELVKNEIDKTRIKFLGVLNKADVYNWLDKLELYIQPSETEGLPRSVIEAMSRGLLVIGSSAGGIPELIDNRFIIEDLFDTSEIYNKILNLTRNDFIESARENFEKSKLYSYEAIKEKRRNFLNDFKDSSIKK